MHVSNVYFVRHGWLQVDTNMNSTTERQALRDGYKVTLKGEMSVSTSAEIQQTIVERTNLAGWLCKQMEELINAQPSHPCILV